MSGAGEPVVQGLIAANDLDGLLRELDRRCDAGDWPAVVSLRDACARAHEWGRQMWPAASHAEYRLALDAPGELAATVVVDGAAHLGLGPLSEVVASTHPWAQVADGLTPGPLRAAVAQERVVRGEDLCDDPRAEGALAEAPLRLLAWEPDYPVATYRSDRVEAPAPAGPEGPTVGVDAHDGGAGRDDDERRALEEVARHWRSASNGRLRAIALDGDPTRAVAALAPASGAVAAPITAAEALAWMAWAAADGGAHGRRRGMAAGRATAWWTAAVLAGVEDPWPADPDELGDALAELEWWWWAPRTTSGGWSCRLAVGDPAERMAWALDAHDDAEEEDADGASGSAPSAPLPRPRSPQPPESHGGEASAPGSPSGR